MTIEDLDEDWEEWDPSKTTFVVHATAGSLAGLAEHTLMFPADTWKTFLQADVGQRSLAETIRRDGITRLWRGTSTMLLGSVPAHAGYFSLYEWGKVQFGANGQQHTPFAAGLSGALATVAHDLIMTPMDVVKQRLQLGFHSGVWDAVRTIVQTQGMHGLYRSFPVALSMNIPFASINVAANESFKRSLNPSGEQHLHISLVCGALAGGVAGALTTPLDVVRTRIQTQNLHPSQFKPPTSAGVNPMLARRPVAPLVSSALHAIHPQRPNFSFGTARAKYTRPIRCPLPIALWAATPGTSTLVGGRQDAVKPRDPARPALFASSGIADTMRAIWLKEGYRGFFRGTGQRIMVQAPAVAISWAVYETAKEALSPFSS
jgi:solute carrier family 25 iron transporter 28/37